MSTDTHHPPGQPLLHSIPEAAALLGVGRSTIYRLFDRGELASVSLGRRRMVTTAELKRYVHELANAESGALVETSAR